MKIFSYSVVAAAAALAATSAFAHHSGAMFDATKNVTVEGTVKEFQWTNPHSWINVMIPNDKGGADEWAFELNSLNVMAHAGWKPTTLKTGDKIKLVVHPMKDGSKAGMATRITLPDGKEMGTGGGGGGPQD